MYTVSITSQGQISIPAPIRNKLGLNKQKRAMVSLENGRVIVTPVTDILDLAGTFKTKKKAGISEIRTSFENYLAKQAISS